MANSSKKLSISVVICAFNEQDWIKSTILSLFDQKRRPDEIIVVDNNSTDRTAAVVEELIPEHPEIPIRIVSEKKQGLHHARETGWRAAKGDIVISTDADVLFPKRWIARYEQAFNDNPDIVAMSGPARYYDALPIVDFGNWIFEQFNEPEGIGKYFAKRYYFNGGNSAYRRTALEAVNGYLDIPPGLLEDLHIVNKLVVAGYKLRYLRDNIIKTSFRRFSKDGWRGYKKYFFDYTIESIYPDHVTGESHD